MPENTRVILCGPSRDAVSGVSTHLNQLLSSGLGRDFELSHFQVGSEGRTEGNLAKLARYLFSPLLLAGRILATRPHIVHLNTSIEVRSFWRDLVYLVVAKALRCKVVYQVHGGALPQEFGGGLTRWLMKRVFGLADTVVLLASSEKAAYSAFGGCRNIAVIPNAIELRDYAAIGPKSYEGPVINLLYLGRLAEDKGIRELVIALGMLGKQGLDYLRLKIIGSGPYRDELERLIARERLGHVAEVVAPVSGDSKIAAWRQADIFVFPTYHREGLPYTILESLASATPVITTRNGAIPDVLADGEQGIFVEPHSPDGVAVAIRRLVENRSLLRDMSARAKQRAIENYGVDRLAVQFSDLYQSVLH